MILSFRFRLGATLVIMALLGIFVTLSRLWDVDTRPLVIEVGAGNFQAAHSGEPDTDGDGVPDALDLCVGAIVGASGADATGCPTRFDPEEELVFHNPKHQLWYRRYWTGSCEGLRFPQEICLPGDPNWHDTVTEVVESMPEGLRGYMRNRLWALGRAAAYDWAQGGNNRTIETNDLRRWGDQLLNADDMDAAFTQIEDEICQMLGSDAVEGGLAKGASCQ